MIPILTRTATTTITAPAPKKQYVVLKNIVFIQGPRGKDLLFSISFEMEKDELYKEAPYNANS